jgi:hypothetical protein
VVDASTKLSVMMKSCVIKWLASPQPNNDHIPPLDRRFGTEKEIEAGLIGPLSSFQPQFVWWLLRKAAGIRGPPVRNELALSAEVSSLLDQSNA